MGLRILVAETVEDLVRPHRWLAQKFGQKVEMIPGDYIDMFVKIFVLCTQADQPSMPKIFKHFIPFILNASNGYRSQGL